MDYPINETHDLINSYLSGEMSIREKADFEILLNEDNQLKSELEKYQKENSVVTQDDPSYNQGAKDPGLITGGRTNEGKWGMSFILLACFGTLGYIVISNNDEKAKVNLESVIDETEDKNLGIDDSTSLDKRVINKVEIRSN